VVETRRLGRTGHASSVAILGAAAFATSDPDSAASAFGAALEAGVNHLDIAPRYGRAQELVGPLIPPVRDQLFVACKTLRANPDGVRAQLEESLTLLGCDRFDLYQLHGVTDGDELERRDGAAREIIRARDEGLCRWIGVTGHNLGAPAAHLEALRRYDLDTVMFPVNPRLWADPVYRRDAEALLDHAADHDVGVMAIKAVAARPWRDDARSATTWYEPYRAPADIGRGVRFTLSVPGVHALCTPGDLGILPTVLAAAEALEPLDEAGRRAAAQAVADEEHIFPMPRG
jgi:aryl-alcohol dehydrogenase-like predicted oxidoreductase